jgi:hypothetical protein
LGRIIWLSHDCSLNSRMWKRKREVVEEERGKSWKEKERCS